MYKFKPIIRTMVWGTETWVLSCVPGFESVVSEGPDAGKTITEIYKGQFPLLFKFIDAKQDLSVQVHPNDEIAMRDHGCSGKTEMWYVIKAEEGAKLVSGFSKEVSKQECRQMIEDGSIMQVLSQYEAKRGEVFFIPAGRVHSIGGGCYIAEVQQASDITYRLYDYDRMGLDGKPRKLHVEEALSAIDFTVEKDYQTHYGPSLNAATPLASCPYFKTDLITAYERIEKPLEDCGDFVVLICLEGSGTVSTSLSGSMNIVPGEALMIFTQDEKVILEPDEKLKLLITRI